MSEWTELTRGFYLEGLLVDANDIWVTDVTRGGVHNIATGKTVLAQRTMVGGLLLNKGGELLVAGQGGVDWVDPVTGATGNLISGLDGVNEMRSDGEGGLIFGTIDLPSVLQGKRPKPSTIRRLSVNRAMTTLKEGLAFANGLSLSPDGRWLFFNESFAASRRFPVGSGFVLGEMETLREMYDCDGMALDADGNVWLCGFGSDYLVCMSSGGEELQRLALPGPACTSLRFGGADMCDLYVTVVDPTNAQKLAEGVPLTEQSSALYRTRAPVTGAPIERTRFKLD